MKYKKRKNKKQEFAIVNIEYLFGLLKSRIYSFNDKKYIVLIKDLSEKFNIRLGRDKKNLFCKNCYTYFNIENRKIRLNKNHKTIEHICLNCGHIKRFKYKK